MDGFDGAEHLRQSGADSEGYGAFAVDDGRMSGRRAASRSPREGGVLPDALRYPSARERVGSVPEDHDSLEFDRRAWYASNGLDYSDWRVRNQVERGV